MKTTTYAPEIETKAAALANQALAALAKRKLLKPAVQEALKVEDIKAHTSLAPTEKKAPKAKSTKKAAAAPKAKAESTPKADATRTTLGALSKRFAAAGISVKVHGAMGHIFFENEQKGKVEIDTHRVNAHSIAEWMKMAEEWAAA